ncbi:hypothetical protein GCM10017620_15250 [Brevundimonas intermedia]|uniref:Uncharacterized protein n=1 Tax=Brevundimonas intermedia TaxID=74315 RepID=A0ABQ5T8Q2_9CAUL|nr:hypothetical protein GCM10017620_15250 [Brevundimonas intermedia]
MKEGHQGLARPKRPNIRAGQRAGAERKGNAAFGVNFDQGIRRCEGQTEKASCHRHAATMPLAA